MVEGNVGFVKGTALHLWHGSKDDRQYASRFKLLHAMSFDPAKHLVLDECAGASATCAVWRWHDAAPGDAPSSLLASFVRRREDSTCAATETKGSKH